MLIHRKSNERGHFDHGWLNTYHSFSFDQYRNPEFDHFSVLRVINEDFISEGEGFPTHGHRDMEIITYVISGALEHKDTLGNNSIIRPGEIQRMTAGHGIRHSEFNHLKDQKTHILQIWLLPQKNDETPGYAQRKYDPNLAKEGFLLIATPDRDNALPAEGPIFLHQDVKIYVSKPQAKTKLVQKLDQARKGWLQLIEGEVLVNGLKLAAGDGLGLDQENELSVFAERPSHFLFFDLP